MLSLCKLFSDQVRAMGRLLGAPEVRYSANASACGCECDGCRGASCSRMKSTRWGVCSACRRCAVPPRVLGARLCCRCSWVTQLLGLPGMHAARTSCSLCRACDAQHNVLKQPPLQAACCHEGVVLGATRTAQAG
jgi:hypothetical protein